jgi:hypothetical protein
MHAGRADALREVPNEVPVRAVVAGVPVPGLLRAQRRHSQSERARARARARERERERD